jgi:hypothetical protein
MWRLLPHGVFLFGTIGIGVSACAHLFTDKELPRCFDYFSTQVEMDKKEGYQVESSDSFLLDEGIVIRVTLVNMEKGAARMQILADTEMQKKEAEGIGFVLKGECQRGGEAWYHMTKDELITDQIAL